MNLCLFFVKASAWESMQCFARCFERSWAQGATNKELFFSLWNLITSYYITANFRKELVHIFLYSWIFFEKLDYGAV